MLLTPGHQTLVYLARPQEILFLNPKRSNLPIRRRQDLSLSKELLG